LEGENDLALIETFMRALRCIDSSQPLSASMFSVAIFLPQGIGLHPTEPLPIFAAASSWLLPWPFEAFFFLERDDAE
jgi:hypothetical protein